MMIGDDNDDDNDDDSDDDSDDDDDVEEVEDYNNYIIIEQLLTTSLLSLSAINDKSGHFVI